MIIKNQTKITLTSKATGHSSTILDTQNAIIGQVVAGIPITECVDNSLDSLVVTVKCGSKQLYEPFDVVSLTVTDDEGETTTDMVIGTDNIQSYQRRQQTFTHVVQLFELTKILEKIKIFNLNLTNTQDALLRQFEKALNNADILVSGATYTEQCRFTLSDRIRALLSGKPSEDFWFSNTDLRSVLDTMLSSSNARATVDKIIFNNVGDISSIVIGYRSLSRVLDIIPEWTRSKHGVIINEEQQNNCQDFVGSLFAKGNNSFCKNSITITDTFKSANGRVSSDTACISLPFPIGETGFDSFKIAYYVGSPLTRYEVEISSRIIPSEKYNLLSENQSADYVPFDIGSTMISVGSYTSKFLWLVVRGFLKVLEKCCIEQNLPSFDSALSDWYNFIFTYTYRPIANIVIDIAKPNAYDADVLKMGIMASQTENTLDVARYGRQLAGLIRRTGNAEWYIDVEATYFRRLLPLMSRIDDGYVVYKREVAIYDNFVKCRYYLSKDYNAIEAKAGVNRERHLYDIPLESDECPLLLKQFMMFSKTPPKQGKDRTFKREIVGSALKTAIGETYKKVQFMLLKTKNGNESFPQSTENSSKQTPWGDNKFVFVRPTLNYGQAKTMNFAATLTDNYSVDYSRDGYKFSMWGDGGNLLTYCRYVSKNTNTIGECDKFEIDFAFKCNFIENRIKYTDEEYNAKIQDFPISDSTEYEKATTQPFIINYYKDRTQKPVFFTNIECLPAKENYNDIVIGTAFCRDNNLVNGVAPSGLKLYISDTEILNDSTDTINKSAYREIGNSVDYFQTDWHVDMVSLTYKKNYSGTGYASWAIANEYGELIIGANGELCTIYSYLSELPYYGTYKAVFSDEGLYHYNMTDKVAEETDITLGPDIQFYDVTFSDEISCTYQQITDKQAVESDINL